MFESVCLTKVMIIFQDLPIIKRMAQIRRERVCPRDSFFRDWNRWNDRFSCCGSLFGTNPAQAGEKAEGADPERVSIKSNRGV